MYPRNSLVQALIIKSQNDQVLESIDKSTWYTVDESSLGCYPLIWSKFMPFHMDEDTNKFLERSKVQSDSVFWQIWFSLASSILSFFMAPTSINGVLGRGSMFLFSPQQFATLLNLEQPQTPGDPEQPTLLLESLLDIGAGDGATTERMSPFFKRVYVTEASGGMRWVLKGKPKFEILDDLNTLKRFSMISCLNVLDRTEDPLCLLDKIKELLNEDGYAIISFVSPYEPYVEFNSRTSNNLPENPLPLAKGDISSQVIQFVEKVLSPNGWNLVRWTRLPYLCEGDSLQSYYLLHDLVFVIQKKEIL